MAAQAAAEDARDAAQGYATAAATSAVEASDSADAAALSASTAESAAGPTYASVPAGEAATVAGESFAVDNGDGTVSIYMRETVGSTLQRTLATTGALAASTGASLVGFIQSGTGAVARTMQEKAREWVSVKDFGAVGDGVTVNTQAFVYASSGENYSPVPGGTYLVRQSDLINESGFIGTSPQSIVRNNTDNERVLFFSNNGTIRNGYVRIENLRIEDGGTDSSDNFAAIFSYGVDLSRYIGNWVSPSTIGVSSQYGPNTLGPYSGNPATESQPNRQSRNNVYAFNDVNASSMGYEMFSSIRHRLVGNNAYNDTTGANSNAYRFTGYPGMPCDGNVMVGSTGQGYLNGISVQTATHYNSFSSFAFTDMSGNGVSLNPNTTYPSDHSGLNYFQGVVARANNGLYADNPSYSRFDLIASNCAANGVWLDKTANYGDGQSCIVDAIVKDSAIAAVIETDFNIVRITAADLTSNAITISGNNNIVDVVMDGVVNASARLSLSVSGNKNIVRCIAAGNSSPVTADVSVAGSDNHVVVMAAVGVSCTGARNTIEGNLGNVTSLAGSTDTILRGTAASVTRGGTNTDYTGLRKGSGRGQVSATSDANGEVTVTVTGLPSGLTAYALMAQYQGFSNNRYVVVKSVSVASNTLTAILRFRKDDGTAAASEAVFAYYSFAAY